MDLSKHLYRLFWGPRMLPYFRIKKILIKSTFLNTKNIKSNQILPLTSLHVVTQTAMKLLPTHYYYFPYRKKKNSTRSILEIFSSF